MRTRGVFFGGSVLIFEKPAKNIEELIDLCERRGLDINNRDQARLFFKYAGYYRLSGYMTPFQQKTHSGTRTCLKNTWASLKVGNKPVFG